MSGDLISRKEALKLIRDIAYSRELSTFECKFYGDVYEGINKIPTAYDVDAVQQELKKMMYEESSCEGAIWIRKAIDIVRNGEKI